MEEESIIATFEREIKGSIRKFWVQLLPDDQNDKIIDYFIKYFVSDEPLCKSSNLLEDEGSMKFLEHIWREALQQKNTLACFTELNNGQKELVSANILYQTSTTEKVVKEKEKLPEAIQRILDTFEYLNESKDISKELGITEYLGAFGLMTIPEYRGVNIGLEVLKARRFLCGKLGLKASITPFTSPASQRLAEKVGFKDLVSITYDDLEKINPSLKYPNINEYSKRIRNMYNLYE